MAKYLKMAGGSSKPKFSDLPVVNFPTSFSEVYYGVSAADMRHDEQPLALSDNFAAYWYMETDDTTNLKVRSGSDQHSVILPYALQTVGFDDTRSLMFTSSWGFGVRLYDVSDLANGMPLVSTLPGLRSNYFVVNGQYLYVQNAVYDITNPASPVSLGNTGLDYVFGVHSSGNYVILYSFTSPHFRVRDVSSSPSGVEVASTGGPVEDILFYKVIYEILKSTNDRVAIMDDDDGHSISALNWVDPLNPITQFPRERIKFYFEDIVLTERSQNLISQSGDLGYLAHWDALVFDLTASELTFIYRGDISAGNVNYTVAASGNRVLFQPILDGATVYGPTTSLNTNPDF